MASTKEQIPSYRKAALIALSQVLDCLAPYADYFVLVGGWAPYMLLQKFGSQTNHIGSADLDLYFNGPAITEQIRDEIVSTLARLGCQQRMWDAHNKVPLPHSYLLPVKVSSRTVQVQIDLMGLDRVKDRYLESHYALALKRTERVKVKIGQRTLDVPVSGAAAVFAMKAIALNARKAPKDAYDLYMLSRYYKDGPRSLAAELKPLLVGPPIRQAVINVQRWFADASAPGPLAVVQFLAHDQSPRQQNQLRDVAFLTVKSLLDALA